LVPNLQVVCQSYDPGEKKLNNSPPGQQRNESRLKLHREILNMFPRMLANDQHLPQMTFRGRMTLETILISTLFLADLAIPA
jgi:hypothetical protein